MFFLIDIELQRIAKELAELQHLSAAIQVLEVALDLHDLRSTCRRSSITERVYSARVSTLVSSFGCYSRIDMRLL